MSREQQERERARKGFLRGLQQGLRTSEIELAFDVMETMRLLSCDLPIDPRYQIAEALRDLADEIEKGGR